MHCVALAPNVWESIGQQRKECSGNSTRCVAPRRAGWDAPSREAQQKGARQPLLRDPVRRHILVHDPRRGRGILDVCRCHPLSHLPLPRHGARRRRRLSGGPRAGAGNSDRARCRAVIGPWARLVLPPGERLFVLCLLCVVHVGRYPRKCEVRLPPNLDGPARAP